MRRLFLIVLLGLIMNGYACKKKTCPAYQENQKEEYKIKNQKRKKSRMF